MLTIQRELKMIWRSKWFTYFHYNDEPQFWRAWHSTRSQIFLRADNCWIWWSTYLQLKWHQNQLQYHNLNNGACLEYIWFHRMKFLIRHFFFLITFGAPERFKNGFVTKSVLSTLHHESQPIVDALMSLLLQNCKKTTKNEEEKNGSKYRQWSMNREARTSVDLCISYRLLSRHHGC